MHKDENRDIRFISHDFLQKSGIGIDRENYELAYTEATKEKKMEAFEKPEGKKLIKEIKDKLL